MKHRTFYEFDNIYSEVAGSIDKKNAVPSEIFTWLENQALDNSSLKKSAWLRLSQKNGYKTIQVINVVGIIQAPNNFQIEVLPKIGKLNKLEVCETRKLLINMLRCLGEFSHIKINSAKILTTEMPLFEFFISEFLSSVENVIKYGLCSDYNTVEENMFSLKGKLKMVNHLRENVARRDRFYIVHDEYSQNRSENRILHTALNKVQNLTKLFSNFQLTNKLSLYFADIPKSEHLYSDMQKLRLGRGMDHYHSAIAWAKLILGKQSPITLTGFHNATSLLFPMDKVFESYVAKHLKNQINAEYTLKAQTQSLSFVKHLDNNWFLLKPDILIMSNKKNLVVMDTKWKLIDSKKMNGTDKYDLAQSDFYQLYAYGQYYLQGEGNVVLIYPKTEKFDKPLPKFSFPQSKGLILWVLPFCLIKRRLILPACGSLNMYFGEGGY